MSKPFGPTPTFPIEPVLRHFGADRTGRRMRCPFHDDRNPSAGISRSGRFVCYTCGIYEDALGLIQREEGVDFATAIERAEAITGQGGGTAPAEPVSDNWLLAE